MEQKRFKMRDEKFICENCGFDVKELGYTARDHCPNCLYSKHVDINPGDRSSECGGLLEPIGIEKFKNSLAIENGNYTVAKVRQALKTFYKYPSK